MSYTPKSLRPRILAATALAAVVCMTASAAIADPHPYKSACSNACPAPLPGDGLQVHTQSSPVKVQVLNLAKGRSAVVDLPVDASDVFVSNPAVADAVLRTPRRIFVLGVEGGQSDAIFFDAMGRQILNLSIRVEAPTDELSDTVHRLYPQSHVDVQSLNGHVILSGMAKDDGQSEGILRLAQTYVDDPLKVVNLMTIAGKDQVTLKVRIVEVNRTTIKQLGFDTSLLTGQLGGVQYSLGHAPTYGVNNKLLGGLTGGYQYDSTSQPVAGYPLSSLFTGASEGGGSLLESLATAGLSPNNFLTSVSNYLLGNGGLTSSQSSWIGSYIQGLLGTVSTQITTVGGTTYTANSSVVGINSSNLQSMLQAYNNGTGTLTNEQQLWIQEFYKELPTYNNQALYSLSAGQNSTMVDHNNPADYVATGRAGNAGVNQAMAQLQAFERVGLVRTLAEPNLTAISGESAKFLAGGEFPVPIGQDNQGRITVEFKPFGVGLGFTPVVMSQGRISLKISSEVSELSNVGSLQLSSSLTIPGLSVRRTETTVEMQSGTSLMISGLLQSKMKSAVDSLPGLTTLPVIGTLLRSRDFLNDETEMVVIVTPYIVDPTDPDSMQTPADNLETPDDPSAVFMGRVNKVIKEKKGETIAAAPAPDAQPYQAPIGYVIE